MLKNKNVLITGADGFIGSHLIERLVKEGARVKALSQYNSFNNWGWLEDVDCKDDIEVLCGDVRDSAYVKHISKGIDVIFHLAALIAIPYSYVAPESYVDTNIKGTLNVCQAALDNNIEKVIVTSTSEVYGTARYVPIDETAHRLHRHARVRRGPRHDTRMRSCGDAQAPDPVARDTAHAQGPVHSFRRHMDIPLLLGMHYLDPRHGRHTPMVAGRPRQNAAVLQRCAP